jgi:transposase-like protein
VGLLADGDGGLVTVRGLATFAWDGGDETGRRLAAVQLVRLRAASQGQVAGAFGVDPATIWRWDQALAAEGVAGLVSARRGPKGASKLTPQLVERIGELDAAGATLREIAAVTGVSTFSVRNALGRVASGRRPAAARQQGAGAAAEDQADTPNGASSSPTTTQRCADCSLPALNLDPPGPGIRRVLICGDQGCPSSDPCADTRTADTVATRITVY